MTVWLSAWLFGTAASDDVLDALAPWGDAHDVVTVDELTGETTGLPGPTDVPTSLTFLLAALRRRSGGAEVRPARLLLAVPGDVRGLPGPGPFSRAVIEAGEGLLFADLGFGLVPRSLGGGLMRWTLHSVPEQAAPEEYLSLPEAERGLRGQVRDSAATLAALGWLDTDPGYARRSPSRCGPGATRCGRTACRRTACGCSSTPTRWRRSWSLPRSTPQTTRAAHCSATAAAARDNALRPLATAIRVARRAAVTEAVRALAGSAGRH